MKSGVVIYDATFVESTRAPVDNSADPILTDPTGFGISPSIRAPRQYFHR